MGEVAGEAKVELQPKEKKPTFVADLQDIQAVEGFPAKMQVKVVGFPPPQLKWLLNSQEIIPSEICKITHSPDGTSTLILSNAFPANSGVYEVVAVNDKGTTSSKGKLFVAPKADETIAEEPPRFVSSLRDVNADEGQELAMSAPFIGNPIPEIIWSKDNVPISPNDRIMMTCDGKHVGLTINPAEVTDSGTYTCLLANPLGEDASKCQSNVRKVYKRPSFSQKLFDQTQSLGHDAKFPVKVNGVPYPELTWYFQDKPLKESDKYKFKVKIRIKQTHEFWMELMDLIFSIFSMMAIITF